VDPEVLDARLARLEACGAGCEASREGSGRGSSATKRCRPRPSGGSAWQPSAASTSPAPLQLPGLLELDLLRLELGDLPPARAWSAHTMLAGQPVGADLLVQLAFGPVAGDGLRIVLQPLPQTARRVSFPTWNSSSPGRRSSTTTCGRQVGRVLAGVRRGRQDGRGCIGVAAANRGDYRCACGATLGANSPSRRRTEAVARCRAGSPTPSVPAWGAAEGAATMLA